MVMREPCRSWWRNCALHADSEILSIDKLEDEIAPFRPEVSRIRELISSLELCHHKAQRWIDNILDAIATGETTKGLGSRPAGQAHAAEGIWQDACTALSAWLATGPSLPVGSRIGDIPTAQLLSGLGERSPLKEWQVQRVLERIRSLIHWPYSYDDPATKYEWILFGGGEYEAAYRKDCPVRYRDREGFWQTTIQTMIHDTHHGQKAELPIGLAIDMLWPCHWNFLGNLQIVLDAIGGQLYPDKPFAACGRNLTLVPGQERFRRIAATLDVFCGKSEIAGADERILQALGQPTPEKRWLAASLAKTIRLQLDPPADVRAASALTGPEWITSTGKHAQQDLWTTRQPGNNLV
jgi:hypothetical protein